MIKKLFIGFMGLFLFYGIQAMNEYSVPPIDLNRSKIVKGSSAAVRGMYTVKLKDGLVVAARQRDGNEEVVYFPSDSAVPLGIPVDNISYQDIEQAYRNQQTRIE